MSEPRAYPVYKATGISWLPEVPSHWDASVPIRYLVNTVGGMTPSTANAEYWDGEIPWVTPKDMKVDVIDGSEDRITQSGLSETGLHLIGPGAVLIVVRGMILAHTFPVAINAVPVTLNQDMKALRSDKRLRPAFLSWFLKGIEPHVLSIVESSAHGTKALRTEQWNVLIVPLPPAHEQDAIVDYVDRETARIDALIGKKRRLLELLEEKRLAVITHAVTKGLDPSAPMKDSGIDWLGQIPAHWEVKRLKFLARDSMPCIQIGPFGGMITDLPEDATGYKLYGQENTISGNFALGTRWLEPERFLALNEYELVPGDIVVTRKGSLGGCRLVPDGITPGIMDSDTIRIRPDPTKMVTGLMTMLLRESPYVSAQIERMKRGAILAGLNTQTVSDLQVAVPPLREQHHLLERLEHHELRFARLAERLMEGVDRLQEFRSALITNAVTGKIDVREAAQREAAQ